MLTDYATFCSCKSLTLTKNFLLIEFVTKYPSTCFMIHPCLRMLMVFSLLLPNLLLSSSSVLMLSISWYLVTESESFLEKLIITGWFDVYFNMQWCSTFPFLVFWRFLFLYKMWICVTGFLAVLSRDTIITSFSYIY